MFKPLLFCLFVTLLSPLAQASSDSEKCCVCQTGFTPAGAKQNEEPAYKLGCSMWLNEQKNCIQKRVESIGSGALELSEKCQSKLIRIGYVGHWNSTAQTIQFLTDTVIPTSIKYDASVQVDNTACNSADDPETLQAFVRQNASQLPEKRFMQVRGDQAISIGMWNVFFGKTANLYAFADSQVIAVRYPTCKTFANKPCSSYLVGQSGRCESEEGMRNITCGGSKGILGRPTWQFD